MADLAAGHAKATDDSCRVQFGVRLRLRQARYGRDEVQPAVAWRLVPRFPGLHVSSGPSAIAPAPAIASATTASYHSQGGRPSWEGCHMGTIAAC